MTDVPALEPVEHSLRQEEVPDDAVVVVRAGPMTVDKLVEHALREQGRYSYRGSPLASISVDATLEGWTVEAILRDRLWSRTSYATTTVGVLRIAGYELLPTFERPHFDIVLPAATTDAAGTLMALFGPTERNMFRRRR
jgi:hypothetical protein